MKIELPDRLTGRLAEQDVMLDLAVGMYAAQHLTLGQAAEMTGISQGQFQRELGRRQIPVHYDLHDLAYDLTRGVRTREAMIVVSDTSCISNLLTINQAGILKELFDTVIIPPAVEKELRRFHADLPDFLKLAQPLDKLLVARFARELDAGEAEAICLARELKADRLLIDEKRGREVALREGLRVIGVVGILVTAKSKGLVPSVAVLLERLEREAGFRLGQAIKTAALKEVGETI